MGMAKTVLWLAAIILLGVGFAGLFFPRAVLDMTGIQAPDPVALSEVRVIFGMLHLLLGAFFASVALGFSRTPLDSALLLLAVLFGVIGLGRGVIVLVDGSWSSFHAQGLALDFVVAGLAFWARSRGHPRPREAL